MAAPRPFGVISVDGSALEGGDGVLHKARFVQRIGVDGHLHVIVFRHAEAGIDRRWGGAPVFVQLQTYSPRFHLLPQAGLQGAVALTHKAKVEGEGIDRLIHPPDVPGTGGTGGGVGARGGSGAAANHGGHPRGNGGLNLLGADEVNVGINAARREDHPFPGDRLGAGANDDVYIVLNVGIARFANFDDAALFNAHIGFDDAPPVQNQGVGNHGVHRPIGAGNGGLAHAVADHLAAAKLDLIPIGCEVLLYLNDQVCVG